MDWEAWQATIHCCSVTQLWLFAIPRTAARQASLSFTISRSLLRLTSIESVMPSNHLILCPLLLPSVFPRIRVFSSESAPPIRWLKCWSFGYSIRTSKEYSGLIFFRIDWFDFLEVQGTLKTSPAPVWRHQFFGTQLFLLSSSHICTWLLEKS